MKSLEGEGVAVALERQEPAEMSHEELVGLVEAQRQEIDGLREELARERELSRIDHLTGLKNRRAYDEDLPQALGIGVRAGEPVSVALVDLDHFKSLNDTRGHDAGDAVLVDFAAFLRESIRSTDEVARYGGEEFALILMGADEAEAVAVLRKIQDKLAEKRFIIGTEQVSIMMSAGVASSASAGEAAKITKCADEALYRAKNAGRSRVVAYADTDESLR